MAYILAIEYASQGDHQAYLPIDNLWFGPLPDTLKVTAVYKIALSKDFQMYCSAQHKQIKL